MFNKLAKVLQQQDEPACDQDDDVVVMPPAPKPPPDLITLTDDDEPGDDDEEWLQLRQRDEHERQQIFGGVKKEKPDQQPFDQMPDKFYDMKQYPALPPLQLNTTHDIRWPVQSGLLRSDGDRYDQFITKSNEPDFLLQQTRNVERELEKLYKRWVLDLRPLDLKQIFGMFDLDFTTQFLSGETEDTLRAVIMEHYRDLHDLTKCLGFVYGSIYQMRQQSLPVNFTSTMNGRPGGSATTNSSTDTEQSDEDGAKKGTRRGKKQKPSANPTCIFGKEYLLQYSLPNDNHFGKRLVESTEKMTKVLRSFNNCARIVLHLHDQNHIITDRAVEDASAFQIINSITNIHVSFLESGILPVILNRVLKVLRENRIHRQDKDLFEPVMVSHNGRHYFSHFFRPFMSIEQFVVNVTTNSSFRYSLDSYVAQYSRAHFSRISVSLKDYLERSEDSDIPKMQPVRGVYAFHNGLYFAYHNEFHEWTDVESQHPTITAYQLVDCPFDTELLRCPLFDQSPLVVPYVDDILNNQPLDDECKRWFWFMYGRMLFPLDNLQISLLLHGVPNSGKSMALRFLELLVPARRIGPVSDIGQNVFGLQDLFDKHLILALDMGKNFLGKSCVLNDRSFNNLVSGELLTISCKNQTSRMAIIDAQFAGAVNLPPIFSQGNLRRIVAFYFSAQLPNDNPNIYEVFAKDPQAIMRMLVKMVRVYLLFRHFVLGQHSFWAVCPQYFKDTNEKLNDLMDPPSNFLREHLSSSSPAFRLYAQRQQYISKIANAVLSDQTDVMTYFGTPPHITLDLFLQQYSQWFSNNRMQYNNTKNGEWKNELVLRQSLTRKEFGAEPSHLDPKAFLVQLIKKHNPELFERMLRNPIYHVMCNIVLNAGSLTANDKKRKKSHTNPVYVDIKLKYIYWMENCRRA